MGEKVEKIFKYNFNVVKMRIYPNKKQQEYIRKNIGCKRVIYNQMLTERNMVYDRFKEVYPDKDERNKHLKNYNFMTERQYKEVPYLKFLKEVPASTLVTSRQNLDNAFKNFYNGLSEKPKYKNRRPGGAGKYSNQNVKQSIIIDCISKKVKIPMAQVLSKEEKDQLKQGWMKYRDSFSFEEESLGRVFKDTISTIEYTASGKFFISIKVEIDPATSDYKKNISWKKIPIEELNVIGLDMSFDCNGFVDSKGNKIQFPSYLKDMLNKLAVYERSLSKKRETYKKYNKNRTEENKLYAENSNNYEKIRLKKAKLHEKVANKRKNWLHHISNMLLAENDVIVIETLNMQAMSKKHGKKVGEMGWGIFVEMLTYKAKIQNKLIIKAPWNYASSKLCNNCGYKNKELGYRREWTCPECGQFHDRDINAAINLKNYFYNNSEEFYKS
jgi:putative transposase